MSLKLTIDPKKDYEMHIIDRGENLDTFGNNTIVPTWDKLSDASVRELGDAYSPDIIRQTMSSDYQANYAVKMKEFWDSGGKEFDADDIKFFSDELSSKDKNLFLTRHKIRTEIGANSEFTGNGLTANTANGGGKASAHHDCGGRPLGGACGCCVARRAGGWPLDTSMPYR